MGRVSLLPELGLSPLVAHLATFGDRPAVHTGGSTVSYGELAARVDAGARSLAGPRRLVLVEGGNDLDTLVGYLAAHAAGHVVLLAGPGQRAALEAAYGGASDLHPDLALLLSTSGSTGSPKLVRLSRRNVLSNATAIADFLGIRTSDVAATTLPLQYCYGLSVVHSHLLVGAALLLTDRSVTDPEFWVEARAAGVTTFPGVPHTFDLLERSGFTGAELPSLRYLTQAGGKMPADTVRRHALRGREHGWDLVVMYGATEATARMAFLPPHLAAGAPETIGIPIPGGSFTVEPVAESDDPEVGELVYRGDNVMLGYALGPEDLARGREVHELRTGDLGRQREDGLFEITGRRSRVAKVFGLRLDLDRIERMLLERGVVAAAADGGDALVLAVASGAKPVDAGRVLGLVREACGLAPAGVRLLTPAELPRLANGKVDYRSLASSRVDDKPAGAVTPDAVRDLYATLLSRPDATTATSFRALGGDSLSYVEASVRLERLLGDLPADWPARTPVELAAVARPPRWGRVVEGSVLLRSLAIFLVVGRHADLVLLAGGAHILLGILGFNFGRFHGGRTGLSGVRTVARSVARVAVPSVLFMALVSLWHPALGWRQLVLLNGWLGQGGWYSQQWRYWFVEEAVWLTLLAGCLLAVPTVHALNRRFAFGLPVAVALVGIAIRYTCLAEADGERIHEHPFWLDLFREGDVVHRMHANFFIFAIGWAAARATTVRQRLVVSVLVLVSIPGYFADDRGPRVMLGLLFLVWVSRVRLPVWLARPIGLVAAASLWIYLVHWEIFPWLQYVSPLLATAVSLAAGVLCWLAWSRLEARAGGWFRPAGNGSATPAVVAVEQASHA